MPVEDKVIAIMAEQAFLKPKEVSLDATLESLGIDSMGLVECIFAIEEEFEVQIPFNANAPQTSAFDITSVKTIVAAVEDLIAARKP